MFHWNLWWVREALIERFQNPYHTDMVYAPEGTPLTFHTLLMLVSLLSIPLQQLLPLNAIYNLYFLFTFVLAGHGAWLLVRALGGDRSGAFLAGVIFSCFALHAQSAGHLNIASYFWIPYCLWAWLGLLSAGGWRWRIRIGLLQTALFLTSLHLLYMTVIAQGLLIFYVLRQQALRRGAARPCGWREVCLTVGFALIALLVGEAAYQWGWKYSDLLWPLFLLGGVWWWLGRPSGGEWLNTLGRAADGALSTLVLCAPFLALMFLANQGAQYDTTPMPSQILFSADALDFLAPPWLLELSGPSLLKATEALSGFCYKGLDPFYAWENKGVFPGYALYALLALMLWRCRPLQHKGWLILAGCFALLALGPFLKIYNLVRVPWLNAEMIMLPGLMLRWLPGGETLRVVARFILPAILALAVFTGLNWRSLLGYFHLQGRGLLALLVVVCLTVIFENHPGGLAMGRFAPPPLLLRLAEYPGYLLVSHEPQYTVRNSGWNMCAQIIHGRPIQDGSISRLTINGQQRVERYQGMLRYSTVVVNRLAFAALNPNALTEMEQGLIARDSREIRDGDLSIWTQDERLYDFLTAQR